MRKKTEAETMEEIILGPSYDVQKEIAETRKKIVKDKVAFEALRVLTAAGIEEETILYSLLSYCGPIPKVDVRIGKKKKQTDVGLKAARQLNEKVASLAHKLKSVAKEFEQVSAAMAQVSAWDIHTRLPVDMRELAKLLEIFHRGFKQGRPAKSGRSHYLFYLAKLVELATKGQHYEEVCDLISAVQEDPEGLKVPSVKSVKRKVGDFEKDHPLEAGFLTEEAEADLDGWKESPARK